MHWECQRSNFTIVACKELLSCMLYILPVANDVQTSYLRQFFWQSLDLLNLLVYHGIADARYIGKLQPTERLSSYRIKLFKGPFFNQKAKSICMYTFSFHKFSLGGIHI